MTGSRDRLVPQFIDILLVDDDEGDILLAKRALENGKIFNTMHVAKDGVEAMAYLNRQANLSMRRGRTWSCSISTCRARTAAKSFRKSSRTPISVRFPSWC